MPSPRKRRDEPRLGPHPYAPVFGLHSARQERPFGRHYVIGKPTLDPLHSGLRTGSYGMQGQTWRNRWTAAD